MKRYDIRHSHTGSDMEESEFGEYVLTDDHDAEVKGLQEKLAPSCEAEVESLRRKLSALGEQIMDAAKENERLRTDRNGWMKACKLAEEERDGARVVAEQADAYKDVADGHVRELESENERLKRALLAESECIPRLATATDALRGVYDCGAPLPREVLIPVRDFLVGQPDSPTRTEAEQTVLDAWGAVSDDTLYMWSTHPSEHVRNTCRAELARRRLS